MLSSELIISAPLEETSSSKAWFTPRIQWPQERKADVSISPFQLSTKSRQLLQTELPHYRHLNLDSMTPLSWDCRWSLQVTGLQARKGKKRKQTHCFLFTKCSQLWHWTSQAALMNTCLFVSETACWGVICSSVIHSERLKENNSLFFFFFPSRSVNKRLIYFQSTPEIKGSRCGGGRERSAPALTFVTKKLPS